LLGDNGFGIRASGDDEDVATAGVAAGVHLPAMADLFDGLGVSAFSTISLSSLRDALGRFLGDGRVTGGAKAAENLGFVDGGLLLLFGITFEGDVGTGILDTGMAGLGVKANGNGAVVFSVWGGWGVENALEGALRVGIGAATGTPGGAGVKTAGGGWNTLCLDSVAERCTSAWTGAAGTVIGSSTGNEMGPP
jgi:hypothetical protein